MTSSLGFTWGAAASSWLLGGERGGECVLLVYPLTQRQAEQPPVGAELAAIVTSVYGGFRKNFLSWVSCSRCSHFEIWCIISVLVSGSHASCVWVLLFGVQRIGFFGRFCFYSCAMLRSTVGTCSASALGAFGRNLHIFSSAKQTRILRCFVSVLTQNGEVCSVDASALSPDMRARIWKSGKFSRFTWLAAVMMARIFLGHLCQTQMGCRHNPGVRLRVVPHTLPISSWALVDIHSDPR